MAASYEAKKLGIKTGASVGLARLACPGLHIVEARPELYLQYHAGIVDVLNRHFATVKVLSVDEMACRIPALYKTYEQERHVAERVKQEIKGDLGPHMRCSIGVAQNVFLAKVAGDMQKPDGLTIFGEDYPERLFTLRLTDLPGIGSRMKARLLDHGIGTVAKLWKASPIQMRRAWGSVLGERWWFMLRGSLECDYQGMGREVKKSVGQSHVLPPAFRSLTGAKEILLQLMAKALKRLRAYNQVASAVAVTVRYRRPGRSTLYTWSRRSTKHLHASDDVTWLRVLRPLLAAVPDLSASGVEPEMVQITFGGLLTVQDQTLSLFEDTAAKERLATAVDVLNRKFGHVVDVASLYDGYGRVPQRIPFGAPDPAAAG